MPHLTSKAIDGMGFSAVGANPIISDKASFDNCAAITLGDNVRIDDFCVLSAGAGGIRIGSFVHVGVCSSLTGGGEIRLSDFCGLSSRVTIYSSNEDYSGAAMTDPTVGPDFSNVTHADVFLCKHVMVGTGSVLLPGITLNEGAGVGALSLVTRDCEAFFIYAGTPARKIKERKRDLLDVEKRFMARLKPQ